MRRNCTEWESFVKCALQIYYYLSLRGYPSDMLSESLKKVSELSQLKALTPQEKTDTNELFMISEYHPQNPNLKAIFVKYWPIIERISSTQSLRTYSIKFGYRKPKNLQDILCRTDLSDFSTIQSFNNKVPLCKKFLRCAHCLRINKTGKIKSTSTSRSYRCLRKVSCNSKNLIYCIECKICGAQCVGQTRNELRISSQ